VKEILKYGTWSSKKNMHVKTRNYRQHGITRLQSEEYEKDQYGNKCGWQDILVPNIYTDKKRYIYIYIYMHSNQEETRQTSKGT
jgi:hypothetical protein